MTTTTTIVLACCRGGGGEQTKELDQMVPRVVLFFRLFLTAARDNHKNNAQNGAAVCLQAIKCRVLLLSGLSHPAQHLNCCCCSDDCTWFVRIVYTRSDERGRLRSKAERRDGDQRQSEHNSQREQTIESKDLAIMSTVSFLILVLVYSIDRQ